jgi:hypothetical protein
VRVSGERVCGLEVDPLKAICAVRLGPPLDGVDGLSAGGLGDIWSAIRNFLTAVCCADELFGRFSADTKDDVEPEVVGL